MKKQDIYILSGIILVLVLVRAFFPTLNFSPVGAIALMGGMLFGKRAESYLIPIIGLFISDIILDLSSPTYAEYLFSPTFFTVYGAFSLIIGLGHLLSKRVNLSTVIGGSILAAVLFFLVTNAASWIILPEYTKDYSGLMLAYERGLPFFRNTLVSQLIFSTVIYFVYSLVTQRKLSLA